jgi:hypothetical protein
MIKTKSAVYAGLSLGAMLLFSIGCKKQEIRVYTAPKDREPETQMASQTPEARRPRPKISYALPQGWKEVPGNQISFVSFEIKGSGEKEATASITRLANLEGKDVELVNMWRQMTGLKELDREEALKQLQPVDVAGGKGMLFETTSESNNLRIITAILHQPEGSWFYKLSGDAPVVEKEKGAFLDFLKSVRVQEPAEEASSEGEGKRFQWTIPSSWQTVSAGQMQVARFLVPPKGDAKAEVFVSRFESDTGGTLQNVNRWRKQLGLPNTSEKDLSEIVSPLDPALSGSILVDMTNNGRRLIGAIVPREGSYWFYKLLGDADAVTPEKESFVAFAKSKP